VSTNVRHEKGRTVIDGVPPLAWGKDRECTFAGALESALAATDHPLTYPQIMGLTALTFRTRWYRGRSGTHWSPSSAIGEGPDEITTIQKASGWSFRMEVPAGDGPGQMVQFVPDILDSINGGLPALVYDDMMNMSVAYGYEEEGAKLLLRSYGRQSDRVLAPSAKLGPLLLLLNAWKEPMPFEQALVLGLQAAVRNHHRKTAPAPMGGYEYGDSAFEAWMSDIANTEGLSPIEKENLFAVSYWNFDCLFDARLTAPAFLTECAEVIGGRAKGLLQRAARHFEQELKFLEPVFATKDAFLGHWSGKTVADWSDAVRKREREILALVRRMDDTGIACVAEALEAYNEDSDFVVAVPTEVPRGTLKVLDGLQAETRWTSHMGCLEGSLRYLGLDVSSAWVYGISGHAFVVSIHDAVSPSGVTAWDADTFTQLAENVGCAIEGVFAFNTDEDFALKQELAWERARKAINEGFPVYAWEVADAEFQIVNGYNEHGYICQGTDGSQHKAWGELGNSDVGVLAVYTVRPAEAPDPAVAIKRALEFAVGYDRARRSREVPFATGLEFKRGAAAYDTWIRALRSGKPTGFGVAYNAIVWSECRRFAAAFLKEARRLVDPELAPLFGEAIRAFRTASASLTKVSDTFPLDDGPYDERLADKALVRTAIEALGQARDAELEGMKVLERIVSSL
jgi:hypothetical protein